MAYTIRPLSRQEARELDEHAVQELGLSTLVLMENAGRGAAAWLAALAVRSDPMTEARQLRPYAQVDIQSSTGSLPSVLIICGPGNNGGDGAVVARHLDSWGFPVHVCWSVPQDQLRGDSLVQRRILEKSEFSQVELSDVLERNPPALELSKLMSSADWVVDGLYGTGLSRPLEGASRLIVEAMNRSGKPILALDLPSGLDADRGVPLGLAVRARATATFVGPKRGFSFPGAAEYTGQVAVIDIGLPRRSLRPFLV